MSNPETSGEPVSSPDFGLRGATDDDFDFARALYFNSMEPLLSALDAWDSERLEEAFRGYFVADEVEIICMDESDVGWMQISRTETELCLDQIHLAPEVCGQGIGTRLINSVLQSAREQGLDVSLSLIKGNPSLKLYKRLGFQLVGEDETKLHMRCRPKDLPT